MTDVAARQFVEGGWNLVWCSEKELDVAQRHGLRGQLTDPLLVPASLDNPTQREKLDAFVARVRSHPALYAYYLTDEPNAKDFPALGRLVAYLKERDPAHLAYINLFPTYANNQQLGNEGDSVTAYRAHLRQYVDVVRPGLISYDHYQFAVNGDNPDYFLNLAMIRQAALEAKVPFLNIVQACTWAPSMRVPQSDEMRYLVNTTLAYGAQGISYYVYSCPGHTGMVAQADGTPTPLYHALKTLNREFVAIASELQSRRSLGVYHAGMMPPGAVAIPAQAPIRIEPPVEPVAFRPKDRVRGALLGLFGPATGDTGPESATHAMIVNLDYAADATYGLRADKPIEVFDPASQRWTTADGRPAQIRLPHGGGRLVRWTR
jgi:hypothetical protein